MFIFLKETTTCKQKVLNMLCSVSNAISVRTSPHIHEKWSNNCSTIDFAWKAKLWNSPLTEFRRFPHTCACIYETVMTALAKSHLFHAQPPTGLHCSDHPAFRRTIFIKKRANSLAMTTSPAEQHFQQLLFGNLTEGYYLLLCTVCT